MGTKRMWALKNKKTGKLYGETEEDLPLMHNTEENAKLDVEPDEQVVRVQVTIEELE